jgi:hypothetical protein
MCNAGRVRITAWSTSVLVADGGRKNHIYLVRCLLGSDDLDGGSFSRESTSTRTVFITALAASFAAFATLTLSAADVSAYNGHFLQDWCIQWGLDDKRRRIENVSLFCFILTNAPND